MRDVAQLLRARDGELAPLRSIDVSSFPELAADMLLIDPATAALAVRDDWARVRALGRRLAAP